MAALSCLPEPILPRPCLQLFLCTHSPWPLRLPPNPHNPIPSCAVGMPEVSQLLTNYRTHQGVLNTAGLVVDLLKVSLLTQLRARVRVLSSEGGMSSSALWARWRTCPWLGCEWGVAPACSICATVSLCRTWSPPAPAPTHS